jgi:hypothetical protein
VELGQVFSEYFGFPCQSSLHQLLHNHPHLSSGAGTIGQKWPQYKGLSPTPLALKKSHQSRHSCKFVCAELVGSLQCSQKPCSEIYRIAAEFSVHQSCFFMVCYNVIFPSMLSSSKRSLSFSFPDYDFALISTVRLDF